MPHTDGRWWFPALLVMVFLLAAPAMRGPDASMYFACTESMATDGDLNSIERLCVPGDAMPVSVTGAFPAFHNHGIVLFWLPLYRYAAALEAQAGSDAADAAFAFGGTASALLALHLTWLLACRQHPPRRALGAVLLVCAGSPLVYYLLQEPLTAQLPALFCAALLWWGAATAATPHDWLRLGLFFGVCLAVKVDLWLYAVLCAVMLWRQRSLRGALLFSAGLLPALTLRAVNDWLRYGMLAAGETHLLTTSRYIIVELLFSSYRGFFTYSPLLLLALAGLIVAWRQRRAATEAARAYAALLLGGGCMLTVKVLLIAMRSAWGGGSFGARHLLTEWPLFALLFLELVSAWRGSGRRMLWFIAVVLAGWNLFCAAEFAQLLDMAPTVLPLVERVPRAIAWWATTLGRNLATLPAKRWSVPLVLATAWLGWYMAVRLTAVNGARVLLRLTVVWLLGGYLLVTVSNVAHHRANAQALLTQGFYAAAEVVAPTHMPLEDRIQTLGEMEHYYLLHGATERAAAARAEMQQVAKQLRAADEAYRARYGQVVRP